MDIIKATAKRGLELRGAIYGDTTNDIVLVMLTGICSNVFQNDLLDATGKLLSQNGITTNWWNIMPNIDKCFEMAKEFVNSGRGDDILPFLFGGFSPMTANTVLGFYNVENLKNCPVLSGQGETKSLYNIKPNGSFIIGSKDSVTGESPKAFMEKLNKWTQHACENQVIEVQGASHIFYNMQDIYAKTLLDCIKNHAVFEYCV